MSIIDVEPIRPTDFSQAATLFINDFRELREKVPILSERMADARQVESRLGDLFSQCQGLSARLDGRLVGYLGWYLVPNFRGTKRTAAYVPEWGHSAAAALLPQVYRALFKEATTLWAAADVHEHAITMLAHNRTEQDFWFWNGFGLLVVDAIRPMRPLDPPARSKLTIRDAMLADATDLYGLDVEHCRHYTQPPIFMSPKQVSPNTAQEWQEFLEQPENAAWMALEEETPVGFIRFDANGGDGSAILEGDATIFINGAFVRPAYRTRGTAGAILDAALQEYAARGYQRCTLDFESVNPQASAFWLRYFQPVAYSLMRVPEWTQGPGSR
jgi:GNAT superfamily N-acetyltransferase